MRTHSVSAFSLPFVSGIACVVVATTGIAAAQNYVGWLQRSPVAVPAGRGATALAHDSARERTVMFGGWTNSGGSCCTLGDTWEWDGNSWWSRQPSTTPPNRDGAGAVYDLVRHRVVMFGGSDGAQMLADTWEWNGADWSLRSPVSAPSARLLPGMVYDTARSQTVLFGGALTTSPSSVLNDTWVYDGSNWTVRSPGTRPPARFGAAIAYDAAAGNTLLFGGDLGGTGGADTWLWDGTNWLLRSPATSPPATWHPAAAFDATRGRVVMFGGYTYAGASNAMWEWDGTTWSLRGAPLAPPPRYHGALAFARSGEACLFGGITGAGAGAFADTWTFRAAAPATFAPFGSGCAGSVGTPQLRVHTDYAQLPWVGTTFALAIDNVPSAGPLPLVLLGWSKTMFSSSPIPLPLSLDAYAMPGCTLCVSDDALATTTRTGTTATCAFAVPPTMSLLGTPFYLQAFVIDAAANPLGATMSNAAAGVIGSR